MKLITNTNTQVIMQSPQTKNNIAVGVTIGIVMSVVGALAAQKGTNMWPLLWWYVCGFGIFVSVFALLTGRRNAQKLPTYFEFSVGKQQLRIKDPMAGWFVVPLSDVVAAGFRKKIWDTDIDNGNLREEAYFYIWIALQNGTLLDVYGTRHKHLAKKIADNLNQILNHTQPTSTQTKPQLFNQIPGLNAINHKGYPTYQWAGKFSVMDAAVAALLFYFVVGCVLGMLRFGLWNGGKAEYAPLIIFFILGVFVSFAFVFILRGSLRNSKQQHFLSLVPHGFSYTRTEVGKPDVTEKLHRNNVTTVGLYNTYSELNNKLVFMNPEAGEALATLDAEANPNQYRERARLFKAQNAGLWINPEPVSYVGMLQLQANLNAHDRH